MWRRARLEAVLPLSVVTELLLLLDTVNYWTQEELEGFKANGNVTISNAFQ